jgi:DNA-directed RNA polymerase subunit RPC12/RpoP
MSIHHRAIAHLDRAITVVPSSEVHLLRYAALELRLAIECLVYQFLPYYRDEIPDEMFDEWRPQVILDALVEANPDLRHSHVLRVAPESQGEPAQWFTIGSQTGMSPKHLRAAHHRLSNFLHATAEGEHADVAKLQRSVDKVIALLEQYRRDTTISNFAVRHSVVCECGRKFSRRARALEKSPFVRCPSKDCKIAWRYVDVERDTSKWEKVTQEIFCQSCKAKTFFSVTQIEPGARLRCAYCGAISRLEAAVIARLERAG